MILRAPTGSGKTEAALLWAATNQSHNGRFFYTLPFTSALNAMHRRMQKEFRCFEDSIGLLHGRAAHHLYSAIETDLPSDKAVATLEARSRAALARGMYYTFRVCTPHQLLRFTLRGKGWEQMLTEIPGSCIIFDEVHSYDPALAGLTLGTAKVFQAMGAKLMFISATLPAFMEELIRQITHAIVISPKPTSETDRPVIDRKRHIVEVSNFTILDLLPRIVSLALSGIRCLVVCNHVRSSQQVATALREAIGSELVCLFHSRFNMRDRRKKELLLASESLPLVLVATQVVEVSLDISYGAGFFEAAPIDALAQRMGRVNRNPEARTPPAPIVVTKPISTHRLYSRERTDATTGLLAKLSGPVTEADLVTICDRVYEYGYSKEEEEVFKTRFDFASNFEKALVAGENRDWIESVIDGTDGRADVLPEGLQDEYDKCVKEKLWLEADALLVNNVYVAQFRDKLDTSKDPWVIRLPYTVDGLQSRE